jgi:hypothetical protein
MGQKERSRLIARSAEDVVKTQEFEIQRELAASLRRAESRVLDAIEALENAHKRSDDEYNALRQEALEARHELVIQREACGFRLRAQKLAEDAYPIPPPRVTIDQVSSKLYTQRTYGLYLENSRTTK